MFLRALFILFAILTVVSGSVGYLNTPKPIADSPEMESVAEKPTEKPIQSEPLSALAPDIKSQTASIQGQPANRRRIPKIPFLNRRK